MVILAAAIALLGAGCATRHQAALNWCRNHGIETNPKTEDEQIALEAAMQWLEHDL